MVTLRILTRKSTLKVGPHARETVQKLLDLKMHRHLRKIYYTYEAISFQDDILDEIGVIWKIDKPGSDPSLIARTNAAKDAKAFGHACGLEKDTPEWRKAMGIVSHNGAVRRRKERERGMRTRNKERLTKGTLQAANHGHIFVRVKED